MCTVDGQVVTCGTGSSGQLGHGAKKDELTPRLVVGLPGKKAVAVAAGTLHTAVVIEGGELFTFGQGAI